MSFLLFQIPFAVLATIASKTLVAANKNYTVSFVMIGANRGILQMTKQHFTILLSMNIPIIIIVTRYDITPQDIYAETMKNIKKKSLCVKAFQ